MTSSGPVVTVAMVTYNAERYVSDAMASVLGQDFTDLELVICDDASTDATWERIQDRHDPRIRAVRNATNLGEYPNRNLALSLARGKYLIFIDGDDQLYRHGLGCMVAALDGFASAAFASAQPWREKFIYPVELTPREYFSCQFLGPEITARDFTQLMFRTQALRSVGGFDPRFRTGDTHIQFLLGMTHNCVLIGDGLAWWRRTPGQASEAMLRDHSGLAELTRYGLELLDDPRCPLVAHETRLARANWCGRMIRAAARRIWRGRISDGLRLLRQSGMAATDWRFGLSRTRLPYLEARDGRDPVRRGHPPTP